MLERLAKKRNIILIGLVPIYLVLWVLTLVFGNREDKIVVLVLSVIMPFVLYGFMRLMLKVVGYNAPLKVIKLMFAFFLIVGAFMTVMGVIEFISGYPNGLSPFFATCIGMITGILDEINKLSKKNEKE